MVIYDKKGIVVTLDEVTEGGLQLLTVLNKDGDAHIHAYPATLKKISDAIRAHADLEEKAVRKRRKVN